ncbi:unnamed protein product [Lactuca saligna]|uniref:Uncharacterized protein n=1 Tax=Lactuca saligna TaxID=75948 RepID=A0AA35Z5X0_LACSI|nr:unnamed protein product [Lactuca saligna]
MTSKNSTSPSVESTVTTAHKWNSDDIGWEYDEVDPESITASNDKTLGTNDNQAPRQNSTTRELFDEDFKPGNKEQVFEEGEYESDGVQILEEVGGD